MPLGKAMITLPTSVYTAARIIPRNATAILPPYREHNDADYTIHVLRRCTTLPLGVPVVPEV